MIVHQRFYEIIEKYAFFQFDEVINIHNFHSHACTLLFYNTLWRRAEDKLDLRAKDRPYIHVYAHTSIQKTNRPFRRSGYTGPRVSKAFNRETLLHSSVHTQMRVRFTERIKKETMEIANKGNRRNTRVPRFNIRVHLGVNDATAFSVAFLQNTFNEIFRILAII